MNYFRRWQVFRLQGLALLIVGLFYFGNASQVFPEDKVIVKFATLAPEGTVWMKEMRTLAREVKDATGGEVRFKFYPGGVSGDEKDVIRKMRIGQLHGAGFTGVGLGEILPEVRVFDIPFLFRTDEQVDKVYNQLGAYFVRQYDQKGYILLGWVPVGWVHIFSTRKVESISDLVKLKPWVWEGDLVAQETYKAMGVNPIPLAITDVLMSLQTGIIDSIYGSSQGVLAFQWFTRVKYMTALRMSHATGGVLISKRKFEKLSSTHQQALLALSKKRFKNLARKIHESNQQSTEIMERRGIQVIPMSSDLEEEKFRVTGKQVVKNLVGRLFSKKILDQVLESTK